MNLTFLGSVLVGCLTLQMQGAWAAAPPPVVTIEIASRNEAPEHLVKVLTNPIEQRLRTVPRIVEISSQTNHSTVKIDAHFANGASRQDLVAVTEQIESMKTAGVIRVDSYEVRIDAPQLSQP